METVVDMYSAIRDRHPKLVAGTDKEHMRRWGEVSAATAYAWFESLAAFVNATMTPGIPSPDHVGLFVDLAKLYRTGSGDIRNCIDVSFVENLFWEVPSDKAAAY